MAELVTVRLLGVDVALQHRAAERNDTIRRELTLLGLAEDDGVPKRLVEVSAELAERFEGFATGPRERLAEAMAQGERTTDLVYELPPEAAEAAEVLGSLLDEVDEFCRQGDLVTLASEPDLVRYRHWFLAQVVDQIRDGADPVPWDGGAHDDRHDDATPAPGAKTSDCAGASHVIRVQGDLDLVAATDLRQQIARCIERGIVELVVDLSGCDFVDSSGASLLLTTRERCAAAAGSLRVEGLRPPVEQTLRVLGILPALTGDGSQDGSRPDGSSDPG
jgi:anti-anti-sigma factor